MPTTCVKSPLGSIMLQKKRKDEDEKQKKKKQKKKEKTKKEKKKKEKKEQKVEEDYLPEPVDMNTGAEHRTSS